MCVCSSSYRKRGSGILLTWDDLVMLFAVVFRDVARRLNIFRIAISYGLCRKVFCAVRWVFFFSLGGITGCVNIITGLMNL